MITAAFAAITVVVEEHLTMSTAASTIFLHSSRDPRQLTYQSSREHYYTSSIVIRQRKRASLAPEAAVLSGRIDFGNFVTYSKSGITGPNKNSHDNFMLDNSSLAILILLVKEVCSRR